MSDSHTNFDAPAFTAGAFTGAGLLAGAVVSGLQAVVKANREAAERWTREQLGEAYQYVELMRYRALRENEDLHKENGELQAENARLRAVVSSLTVRAVQASR